MLRRLFPLWLVLTACVGLLVYEDVDRHVRAAAMLMRWTHAPGPDALRSYGQHAFTEHELHLTLTDRDVAAIEYRPTDVAHPPPVILIHGAHYRGMREARLKEFARAIASAGLWVFTPQLDELTHHNVTASTITTLQQLARSGAKRTGYVSAGVVGISFAGSLALLAAARDTTANDGSSAFSSVTAVGSYASLDRLGLWYAGDTARGPDQQPLTLQPHPYGARVLFQAHADTVFGSHADAVRRVLHAYLHDQLKQAHALAMQLPEPPRSDVLALVGPEQSPLASKLRALLHEHHAELAAVSPAHQLSTLRVPVLLVHGKDDPIIPSTETAWLEREVPRGVLRASLVTDAIRHAELQDKPSVAALWALVQWAAALLEVSEHQPRAPLLQ